MAKTIAEALKQTKPFDSKEEEIVLALQHTAARVHEPWARFLKTNAQLTASQYNVLRILRGAHPTRLTCTEISDRMVARDPDVTRLIDRLATRALVDRARDHRDRRVVEVGITAAGLALLKKLDPAVKAFPGAVIGHLGRKRLEQLGALLQELISSVGVFPQNAKP